MRMRIYVKKWTQFSCIKEGLQYCWQCPKVSLCVRDTETPEETQRVKVLIDWKNVVKIMSHTFRICSGI